MDGVVELAKMLKQRENRVWTGIQTGEVIAEFPDIQIRINEKVVLQKEKLLFASHMVSGYEREIEIEGNIEFEDTKPYSLNGTINFSDSSAGQTSVNNNHSHSIASLNVNTDYNASGQLSWEVDTNHSAVGKITYTSTLEVGDEVILIPTSDEQRYYVIDKVVTV